MAKILIVEDEKVLNEAYELILKKEGHKVCVAFDGAKALEMFAEQKPDLVLLDLRMPKMSGVEFLQKANPSKNFPKTKIIIFSNYDDQKEIDAAFEHGASRYILKAWSSPKELVKVVRETLASSDK
ncbi:response regulator [Candidatus Saccharibacteria bacterium]|nr:response regulator [Candidatus Saccharibacteria bacterium]